MKQSAERCWAKTCPEHRCAAPDAGEGYRFSKAMENPGFIGIGDIVNTYLPMGFSHFKIEGRGLGSALMLEFLLYYLTKPGMPAESQGRNLSGQYAGSVLTKDPPSGVRTIPAPVGVPVFLHKYIASFISATCFFH